MRVKTKIITDVIWLVLFSFFLLAEFPLHVWHWEDYAIYIIGLIATKSQFNELQDDIEKYKTERKTNEESCR
jgi:hypothetical protein